MRSFTKIVFLNLLRHLKQLRYAEHYHEYSHKKLGRKSVRMATTSKNTKKDLHTMI
jgi:hypothetical protein